VGGLGLAAAFMGPILERRGPMLACFLGTTLFLTGNLLTALALYLKQIWLVFLGYGVVAGFGIGVCYISPVSSLQKWFPDRRGLAAGLATCGFGAGSIAIAKVQLPLMHAVGLPLTFVVLGSSYFVIMMLAACVLRTPPPGYWEDKKDAGIGQIQNGGDTVVAVEPPRTRTGAGCSFFPCLPSCCTFDDTGPKTYTLIEALSSRDFRAMFIMFSFNIIFGLVLISTVVAINGGFNLGGRLLLAFLSDKAGRKNCFIFMLSLQVILLGCFSLMTNYGAYWPFLVSMWSLTACYGGGFGIIPAFLSDKFGSNNIGACHGIILIGWSFAGICGGLVFTTVFNALVRSGYSPKDPYPYNLNVWWIFGLVCIGWVSLLFVAPLKNDIPCHGRQKK
jgi:MFS family permease